MELDIELTEHDTKFNVGNKPSNYVIGPNFGYKMLSVEKLGCWQRAGW